MKREECLEVIDILRESIGNYFDVMDYDYFVVCKNKESDYKEIIVHGYGNSEEPYEVIFTRIFSGKSHIEKFENKNKFYKYLRENVINDIVIGNL